MDEVKALNRGKQLDEAATLLSGLIDAVEAEARVKRWSVAPWYYEQLAITNRQRKDYEGEVSVLERLKRHGIPCEARLRKARQLRDDATTPRDDDARSREGFLSRLNAWPFFATDEEILAAERELESRFGQKASDPDVFWAVANQKAIARCAARRWQEASGVYAAMAEHLAQENRDWFAVQRESVMAMLRFFQPRGHDTRLELVGCECSQCSTEAPRTVTIAQALREPPPPHRGCQKPPCKCRLQEKH